MLCFPAHHSTWPGILFICTRVCLPLKSLSACGQGWRSLDLCTVQEILLNEGIDLLDAHVIGNTASWEFSGIVCTGNCLLLWQVHTRHPYAPHPQWSFKELGTELKSRHGSMDSNAYQNENSFRIKVSSPSFQRTWNGFFQGQQNPQGGVWATPTHPRAVWNILKGSHSSHMLSESYFQIPLKAWVKCAKFKFWIFRWSMWSMPTKVEYNNHFAAKFPVHNSHAKYCLIPISSNLFLPFFVCRLLPTFLGLLLLGYLFRLQLQTHHCDFLFNKHYSVSSGKQWEAPALYYNFSFHPQMPSYE